MFNWTVGFINNIRDFTLNAAFIFAFGNLIVSTALDLAFHGILKIRLAGASVPPAPVVKPSLDLDEVDQVFNVF